MTTRQPLKKYISLLFVLTTRRTRCSCRTWNTWRRIKISMSAQSNIAGYKGFAIKKTKAKKKRNTVAAQNCRMLPRKDDVKCGRCPEWMDVISVQTMSYRETKIQSCANLPSHRHLSCRNSRWGQYTVAQVTSATSWLPDDRESDQRGNVMHARWGESHWSVKRSPWRRNTIGDMHRFCGRRWKTKKISWQKT